MAAKTIVAGSALIALGILVSIASDSSSVTSFIPAMVGVIFLGLGLGARMRPAIAHHLMHAAAAIALLVILGSIGSTIGRGSTGWALFAQLGSVVIAGVYLAYAVASFRRARQARSSD
jgi:hypothetical protein